MTLRVKSYVAPILITEKDPLTSDGRTSSTMTNSLIDKPPDYNEIGGRRRKADKVRSIFYLLPELNNDNYILYVTGLFHFC